MQLVDIVGSIALVVTVLYTGFGLPLQISKNYHAKSTKSLSLSMMILLILTSSSWVLYGFVRSPEDWYIIFPNSLGFLSGIIILYQFWLYRSKSQKAINDTPAEDQMTLS
jgi:uncharacterized protein with PQ loop repeat